MQIGWKVTMELDLDQKKKLVEFINKKWPEPQKCPICGEQEWTLPEFISEVRDAKARGSKVTFSPVIGIICLNCGYTFFLNAMIAGIYMKEEMKASNEVECTTPENGSGKK